MDIKSTALYATVTYPDGSNDIVDMNTPERMNVLMFMLYHRDKLAAPEEPNYWQQLLMKRQAEYTSPENVYKPKIKPPKFRPVQCWDAPNYDLSDLILYSPRKRKKALHSRKAI